MTPKNLEQQRNTQQRNTPAPQISVPIGVSNNSLRRADRTAFFAVEEDGGRISFAANARLPRVCLTCASQRGVSYYDQGFRARRAYGEDVAMTMLSGRATVVSTRAIIPMCKRCRIKHLVAMAGVGIGAAAFIPSALLGKGTTFFGALVVIIASLALLYRTHVRSDRVDEDGILRLSGVHRLARSDIIDASQGRFVRDVNDERLSRAAGRLDDDLDI